MPPAELTSWVALVKDAVTGCAAVIGAVVAVKGLSAWKKQLKGRTDYELARRLLKASYKVREEIRSVRHPAIWSTEAAAAEKQVKVEEACFNENPNAARTYAVYNIRWGRLVDAVSELNSEAFEAEISWGEQIKLKISALNRLINLLRIAISQHLDGLVDKNSETSSRSEGFAGILYDLSDGAELDEFAQKVQAAITSIEESLRPHLGSK